MLETEMMKPSVAVRGSGFKRFLASFHQRPRLEEMFIALECRLVSGTFKLFNSRLSILKLFKIDGQPHIFIMIIQVSMYGIDIA